MTITKMDVAKEAANLVTSAVFSSAIATVITRTTDRTDQDTSVRVISALGGWYISNQYRETTDRMVENAAAKLSEWRESYRTKKQVQA